MRSLNRTLPQREGPKEKPDATPVINIACLLVVAALGPYLSQQLGIRTEQIVNYFMFIFLFYKIIHTKYIGVFRIQIWAWLSITIVGFVNSMLSNYETEWVNLNASKIAGILSGLDNMLSPFTVFLTISTLTLTLDQSQAKEVLRTVSKIIILLLSLNSVLALAYIVVDLTAILSPFWSPGWQGTTPALDMGRITGIFALPFEAGVTYSLGLFLVIYILKTENPTIQLYGFLSLIVVGGALTVSKAFLFIGGPLGLAYSLSKSSAKNHDNRSATVVKLLGFSLVVVLLLSSLEWFASEWAGWTYLSRFFVTTIDDPVFFFSGGRFGADGLLNGKIAYVRDVSPLFGLGFNAYAGIDNAYLEIFAFAGLSGLFFYLVLFLSWLIFGFRYCPLLSKNYEPENGLFWCIVTNFVIAGLGAPVLTINRFATISFVIFTILLTMPYLRHEPNTILPVALRQG